MANYAKTTWATGDTINATKLNNVEDGVNNLTIAGTASQVLVNGSTTAVNNAAVALTLPQSIATGSSPTFTNLTLSGSAILLGSSAVSGAVGTEISARGNDAGLLLDSSNASGKKWLTYSSYDGTGAFWAVRQQTAGQTYVTVRDGGAVTFSSSITALGAAQNITGSRGGNAALASLLTALASIGLITDGTTA